MKYFIRTTNQRKIDESYNQIDYELLVDREGKPLKSLIEQYKYISQYDCVLLEDDLVLCKGFKEKIEEVIFENPDKIINFFFAPTVYFESFSDEYKDNFHFSQCRYYPKGITDKIAKELEKVDYNLATKTAKHVQNAANKLGYNIYQYRPCLVQHLDFDSLCKNCYGTRRTIWFIDYLKDLKIDYSEANLTENKNKLRMYMKNDFDQRQDSTVGMKGTKKHTKSL